MIDKTKPMPTLILGGPADALRIALEPGKRTYLHVNAGGAGETIHSHSGIPELALEARHTHYAIGTLRGTFGEIFYVGVRNLNDCAIRMLLAGFHNPAPQPGDENVAEQMVTLIGGEFSGRHMALPDNIEQVTPGKDTYIIVNLVGKDQKQYRVGLRDPLTECPIKALIEGYRVPEVQA